LLNTSLDHDINKLVLQFHLMLLTTSLWSGEVLLTQYVLVFELNTLLIALWFTFNCKKRQRNNFNCRLGGLNHFLAVSVALFSLGLYRSPQKKRRNGIDGCWVNTELLQISIYSQFGNFGTSTVNICFVFCNCFMQLKQL
jgi:NADH:ubiquinone oxidoreductase subunit 6 (subunit J)